MAGNTITLTDETFEQQVLRADRLVIVDLNEALRAGSSDHPRVLSAWHPSVASWTGP